MAGKGGSGRSGSGGKGTNRSQRHVVKSPLGGWDIKEPGKTTPTGHEPTQADAERIAKQQVTQAGGGEVVIHRLDGRIRDKDTVAPANDPHPPKDTKH
jgi:hypothetical protein